MKKKNNKMKPGHFIQLSGVGGPRPVESGATHLEKLNRTIFQPVYPPNFLESPGCIWMLHLAVNKGKKCWKQLTLFNQFLNPCLLLLEFKPLGPQAEIPTAKAAKH